MNRTIVELLIDAKDATAAAFASATARVKGLYDGLLSMHTLMAGLIAGAVYKFGKSLVDAFAGREQAINTLNAALRVTGRYTDEASAQIQRMADTLEVLTGTEIDASLAVAATIAQLTHTLSAGQIAQAEKAAIALSSAFGISTERAGLMIAKALGGATGSMARYGINLKGLHTEQQRFQVLVDRTGPLFDVAVQKMHTFQGAVIQLKEAYHEWSIVMGQVIAGSLRMTTDGRGITEWLQDSRRDIRENMGTWVKWGQVAVDVVRIIVDSVLGAVRIAWNFGQYIGSALDMMLNMTIYGWLNAINLFMGKLTDLGNWWRDQVSALVNWSKEHIAPILLSLPGVARQVALDLMAMPPLQMPHLVAPYIDTTRYEAQIGVMRQGADAAVGGIRAALTNVRGAWDRFIADINSTPLPASAFELGRTGAGANLRGATPPPVDSKARMQELTDAAKNLEQQLTRNDISADEFRRRLAILGPQLLAFRATLSGPEAEKMDGVLEGLGFTARKLGLEFNATGVHTRSFFQDFRTATIAARNGVSDLNTTLAEGLVNVLEQIGPAIGAAFEAMVSGSKSASAAFRDTMIAAIRTVADSLGKLFIGKALGAIGEAIGGDPRGWAAAAAYFAAAAAFYALGGAIGGISSRGSGGGGGSSSAASSAASSTETPAGDRGTLVINLPAGRFLDMNDPRQYEAFVKAMQEISGRDAVVTFGSR